MKSKFSKDRGTIGKMRQWPYVTKNDNEKKLIQ